MDISKVLYERYKLYWMAAHGYTIADIITTVQDIREDYEDDTSIQSVFEDWEYSFGFGGEIWACYDEFMDVEFLDVYLMKQLIFSKEEYNAYLEY